MENRTDNLCKTWRGERKEPPSPPVKGHYFRSIKTNVTYVYDGSFWVVVDKVPENIRQFS